MEVSGGSQNWVCPQSRQAHNIAVESLPRNYFIEQMIEKFNKNQSKQAKPKLTNQFGTCQKHNRPIEIGNSYKL